MVIEEFKGKYRFLSNFFPVAVYLSPETVEYPSVEHAYQAAKTEVAVERRKIAAARTAAMAKKLGRKVTLRDNWDKVKLIVMLSLLRQKFHGAYLKRLLLETGDAMLVECNYWGDRYWGVYQGVGENHLGKLLMQVRQELKEVSDGR